MKVLITGTAGFIGFHLASKILESSSLEVVGLDNINSYYDTDLKRARLASLGIKADKTKPREFYQSDIYDSLRFIRMDLTDESGINQLFKSEKFDYVIHLAAQAGVRYSLKAPRSYIQSNITGFLNILEGCRHNNIKHFIYASSSSVYGLNSKVPFSESDRTDKPVSLYAATKRSDELIAYSYSHLYGIPCTGLRFFTVYGSYGRPDMAYYIFTKRILEDQPIQVFNYGKMKRDFTYVKDITHSLQKLIELPPTGSGFSGESLADKKIPFAIYNIGNSDPVEVLSFIKTLEKLLGKEAILEMKPMQPGDVEVTYSDTNALSKLIGYQPNTKLEDGLKVFVDWYLDFYQGK